MGEINKKLILTGALTLTVAGVITRVLGFVYRIYMSNVLGAEGMGLLQLIMPVYALAWSIACAGFNTTISKLTAQEKARGEYGNMARMLKQSMAITVALGFILTAFLYMGAELLAVYFFRDNRVVLPLQILALAFPFMAAGTSLRGYFIGLQETKIPALNQVLEQIVRMVVIFFVAAAFVPRGLEWAAAAAVIAIVAEEIFSFLFVYFAYKRYIKKKRKQWRGNFMPSLSPMQSIVLILSMALPLTGNRVAGSLLTAWENVLIPRQLQAFGLNAAEAISEFGRVTGMAVPLIFFPTAVLTALSVTLVPAVSQAAAARDMKSITQVTTKALTFASITGMGAAALFMFFSHELGMAIYNQPIGLMLQLLGIMCPFIYMQIVLSGVLNGLGYQMFIFRNSLLSSAVTIAFIFFAVPVFGLPAYIFGWLAGLVLIIALSMHRLKKYMTLEMHFTKWLLRPALAAVAGGLVARLAADRLFFGIAGLRFGLVLAIALLMGIFLGGVVLSGGISKAEVQWLFRLRK